MKVMVTGGTGFIGWGLVEQLRIHSVHLPHLALRRPTSKSLADDLSHTVVGNISPHTDWRKALADCDAVVHCAAQLQGSHNTEEDLLAAYKMINVEGTLKLARQAADSGAKRFIFISSIKVNGQETTIDTPFTADDKPNPVEVYGISKYEAEQGLWVLSEETGMEIVIIRPPLVYGPGVKGNFLSLLRWLHSGLPLPFKNIHNKRSLVARSNLIDLIITCLDNPAAANQVFLAGDGEDLSTPELLNLAAKAMGKPARLIPVSANIIELGARAIGRPGIGQRLCRSLRVDVSKTRSVLGWQPPATLESALRVTVQDFMRGEKLE